MHQSGGGGGGGAAAGPASPVSVSMDLCLRGCYRHDCGLGPERDQISD